MRAHVLGTTLPEKYPRTFSAVLFGPPGTGKTTLLKALARSAGLPLVQLTPSDIARAGEQGIEKTAKQIFDALSMLTSAVIIFDEFEPILLKREAGTQNEARNIFTFLTPGMLPKITKLYEAAKKQGIAYCLVTNHYQKLDEAAIRRERFDEHIVINHPDVLSRAGMFLDRLRKFKGDTGLGDEGRRRRFDDVIRSTGRDTIQDLATVLFKVPEKEGEDLIPGTYAYYVLSDGDKPNVGRAWSPVAPDGGQVKVTKLEGRRDDQERELADNSIWAILKK
jgi:SpoVK/Ycf46/Vps4 family AAA+-type ATPase